VEDDDVTLKYVDGIGTPRLGLRPHNTDYPTRVVAAGAVSIEGVSCGLLRGEVADVLLASRA
jgi:hypothetical protein